MTTGEFKKWCINQHDYVCNQKYDESLPYSFHLKSVAVQYEKFKYLLPSDAYVICEMGCFAHELIEDARITYYDIVSQEVYILMGKEDLNVSKDIAEVVYLCTDFKGRDRDERKPQQLYIDLAQNKLAVFVKLCDIIANSKYSLLQNSSMLKKYKQEYYAKVKPHLYTEEYKDMFNYLEKIYEFI